MSTSIEMFHNCRAFGITEGVAHKAALDLHEGADTRSLSLSRILKVLKEFYEEGLVAQCELPLLSFTLREYLEECGAWAAVRGWRP